MKKYLIAALAIIGLAFSQKDSYGQSNMEFAPDHAEWWHYFTHWEGPTGGYGLNHSFVKGDTLIQGRSAKIIQQDIYFKNTHEFIWFTSIDTTSSRDLYIYDAVDTVFIFNENFNQFTPLFVYNVNEGDTVCLPVIPDRMGNSDLRPNPIANGDTCFCIQIDSIRMVLYDTTYLKTYFQHSLIDTNYLVQNGTQSGSWPIYNWRNYLGGGVPLGLYISGAYAQKIGGTYSGLLPIQLVFNVSTRPLQDSLIYSENYAFKCYQEDSFAIHFPDQFASGCFFDPPTGIRSVDDHMGSIQIYPNPNNGLLTLEASNPFEQKTRISIADLSGRVLKSWKAPAGRSKIELNVKDLSPGMYLLRFETGGGMLFRKVVVQ